MEKVSFVERMRDANDGVEHDDCYVEHIPSVGDTVIIETADGPHRYMVRAVNHYLSPERPQHCVVELEEFLSRGT